MGFSALTSTEIEDGKPITETLMQKIKDNFDYLYGLTGGGIQPANGSFEIDSDSDNVPDQWTASTFPGGTVTLETTSPLEGAKSIKMVHPGGSGNGGGYLQSDYNELGGNVEAFTLSFLHKATAAGMKNQVAVFYFDKDKVALTGGDEYDVVYNSTSNPTTTTLFRYQITPPATARYCKIKLVGGFTDTDVAGTAYFDKVVISPDFVIDTTHIKTSAVTQGKVASSAICQSKLETSTQTNTNGTSSYVTVNLTGGQYIFQTVHYRSGGSYDYLAFGDTATFGVDWRTSTSYGVQWSHKADVSSTSYLLARFVTASPPYDLGDGMVGLFIFALVEKVSGNVIAVDICEDPPWTLNGPTDATPQYWKNGKPYRKNIIVPDLVQLKTPGFKPQYEEIEITQAVKNADMDLIQSPFTNVKPDQQVIMLDPVSDLNHQLKEIYNHWQHRDKLHDFIHTGDLLVDNTPLSRFGPKDIPVHGMAIR